MGRSWLQSVDLLKKVLYGETKSTAILTAMKHLLTYLILVSLWLSRGECRGGKSLKRHDIVINYVNLVENRFRRLQSFILSTLQVSGLTEMKWSNTFLVLSFRDCNCRHHAWRSPVKMEQRVYLFTKEMTTFAFVSQNTLENTVRTIVSHLILALSVAKANKNKNVCTSNFIGN